MSQARKAAAARASQPRRRRRRTSDAAISLDSDRLRRVVINLMDNAAQAMTEEQGEKRLTLSTVVVDGAVALTAAASLASGLPFVIVRKEQKDYGTARRLEGDFVAGEEVCLVEDVITSGGAAVEAVRALREAGLTCRIALCVVDREEGGADALAREAVRLAPLFRAAEVMTA